jgi:hypothetical protein
LHLALEIGRLKEIVAGRRRGGRRAGRFRHDGSATGPALDESAHNRHRKSDENFECEHVWMKVKRTGASGQSREYTKRCEETNLARNDALASSHRPAPACCSSTNFENCRLLLDSGVQTASKKRNELMHTGIN